MFKKTLLGVALLGFLPFLSFSQSLMPKPSTPQPGGFQPVDLPTPQPATMPRYDNYNGSNTMPRTNVPVQMGSTAGDIIRMANRNNPYYRAPGDNRSIQQITQERIFQELQNDPAYNPNLRNGVSNNFPVNKAQELHDLLQDILDRDYERAQERGTAQEDFNSPAFAAKTKAYNEALSSLKNMLSGKQKISLSEAYYTMELAYGEPYLTKEEFNGILRQSADFIKTWMNQNHLNVHNNVEINFAVQQFMGEELKVYMTRQNGDGTSIVENVSHAPFSYDFNDYTGDKDHRNFFVTKCLATGTGQCNSMPAVYLLLVEALGGKAYLALAPQHSLVKYPDAKGNLRNYEPTSHWDISSEWYYDNLFISSSAAKNGIYLNPWGGKQIVADIVLQLSFGYFKKFGGADGNFINQCVQTAQPYFPKHNNLISYFTMSNLYGYQLAQILRKYKVQSLNEIPQYPEAQKIFEKWQANETIITNLGYQEQPQNMYEEMMKYHEFKGKTQEANHFDTKQKHSLFTKSSFTKSK